MNRELQNMSEVSLQNLEEIVETELLTVYLHSHPDLQSLLS